MSDNNPENNNNISSTPAENQPTGNQKSRRRFRSLLWVIIVLLIGIIVGIISFLLIAPHIVYVGPPPFGFPPSSGNLGALFTLIAEHIILSTVSIALLVSLVVVYARTYGRTRANFALGIFVVLLALLFEAILNYPILQLLLGPVPKSEFDNPLPTLADVFTIVAYTVFLYLSLE
jgi:heme A synthase